MAVAVAGGQGAGPAVGPGARRPDRHHGERRDRVAAGPAGGDRARQREGGAGQRDRDGGSADRLLSAARPVRQAPPAADRSPAPHADSDDGRQRDLSGPGRGPRSASSPPTDQAQGDHAVYDIDQAVLVVTGHDLKLTTPNDVLTARDTLEYWSQKHMAVARGNAVVVTNDGRRLAADTLVAYTTDAPPPPAGATPVAAKPPAADDPLGASGKLQKVEAYRQRFGAHGDRHRDRRPRRLRARHRHRPAGGRVRITRGQNQLDGSGGGSEHEDRHFAACWRAPASGCRGWSCRTMKPAGNSGPPTPGQRPRASRAAVSRLRKPTGAAH